MTCFLKWVFALTALYCSFRLIRKCGVHTNTRGGIYRPITVEHIQSYQSYHDQGQMVLGTTGRTRVNIGAAFQRWREQKEWKGIYSYSCVVSFWWMSNIDFALFHTTYPCWLSLEYAVVSPLLVSAIVVAMVLYACVDVEYLFKFHIHFRTNHPNLPGWHLGHPWSRWRHCLLSCDLPPFILKYTPPNSQHGVC